MIDLDDYTETTGEILKLYKLKEKVLRSIVQHKNLLERSLVDITKNSKPLEKVVKNKKKFLILLEANIASEEDYLLNENEEDEADEEEEKEVEKTFYPI